MPYLVQFAPKALEFLEKQREPLRQKLFDAIDDLEEEPRPPDCVKLSGKKNEYRIRVGDCRILYEIHDDQLIVLVFKVGHRKDVYRGHGTQCTHIS